MGILKVIRPTVQWPDLDLTCDLNLNPRRHRPFRILPRHKGGVGTTPPLPFRPWLS